MGWCVSPRWWLLTIGAISGFFLIFWEQRYANSKHKEEFVVQEQNFGAPFRRLAPARRRPRQPSEDDIPRNALGFLCQDNPLVEDLGTRCRTISKNIGSLGCDRKIVDLAAEKSRNIDAIPPAFRMARVADACPESCGLCETCAPGCARWFIRNGYCENECNNADCQFDGGDCWDIDCVVGGWNDWSECSITCDREGPTGIGGTETRTREVVVAKTLNGKACPDLIDIRLGCNKGVPCPVPCELSAWSEWSPCSAECGPGQSTRHREMVKPPQNGAADCPDLVQSRACLLAECSRSCKVSLWGSWSECSNSCGPGVRTRKRSIHSMPVGEDACPPLLETEPCIGVICGPIVIESCRTTAWSKWTPCSAECGGGIQSRKRTYIDPNRNNKLAKVGASCPPLNMVEEQICNAFECSKNCALSEWSEWSNCNAQCGLGVSRRTREILTAGSGTGVLCPKDDLQQEKECYAGVCDVDCTVSQWSAWSDCVATSGCGFGLATRSRSVLEYPLKNGQSCPPLSESKECQIPCDIGCQLGSLSPWTDCSEECQVAGKADGRNLLSYRWQSIDLITNKCPNPNSLVQTKSCSPSFSCREF